MTKDIIQSSLYILHVDKDAVVAANMTALP